MTTNDTVPFNNKNDIDIILDDEGSHRLVGGASADLIIGGAGDDSNTASADDDCIFLQQGADHYRGAGGDDVFIHSVSLNLENEGGLKINNGGKVTGFDQSVYDIYNASGEGDKERKKAFWRLRIVFPLQRFRTEGHAVLQRVCSVRINRWNKFVNG